MRKFLVMVLAALTITAFSGVLSTANAADEKKDKKAPNVEEMFKKKDKDSDGKISFEEFAGKAASDEKKAEGLKARFGKLDKDSDGSLNLDEFKASMAKGGDKPAKKKKPADDDNN